MTEVSISAVTVYTLLSSAGNLYAVRKKGWYWHRFCVVVVCLVLLLHIHQRKRQIKDLLAAVVLTLG